MRADRMTHSTTKVELPNSGHFRFEIVFFLEAAFSAAVFILCVLHQHLAIIPAKIRLETTVLCAQRVLMFGTVTDGERFSEMAMPRKLLVFSSLLALLS